jgi:hypothetical protein
MGLQRIQARTLKGLFIKVHAAILFTLCAFAVQTAIRANLVQDEVYFAYSCSHWMETTDL